jgi:hypothetical protein
MPASGGFHPLLSLWNQIRSPDRKRKDIPPRRPGKKENLVPFQVSYDSDDQIIILRVSGDIPDEEHYTARAEAIRLCRENHCGRMLVDLRELSTTQITVSNSYAFGKSVAEEISSLKLAHVLPQDSKASADVLFTSTVEANRGVNVRQFGSMEEARNWLLA